MSEFQIILTLVALTIFGIFFKQLFSGDYPKRGVDFEAKTPQQSTLPASDATGISNRQNRVEQLFDIAKKALDNGDNIEAKKALQSLLILEPKNMEAIRMLGVAYMNMNDFSNAKAQFLRLLDMNPNDDLAHNLLANTLHKLGEEEAAIKHHKKALELDSSYAPYYFNYANTLYDLGNKEQALNLYKKAIELDKNLTEAKKMISEIENGRD